MVQTRAQAAAEKKRSMLPAKTDQGEQPQGIRKHRSTTRLQKRPPLKALTASTGRKPSRTVTKTKLKTGDATYRKRDTKRPLDALNRDPDVLQDQLRPSLQVPPAKDALHRPAIGSNDICEPIAFWATQGRWPQGYFRPDILPDISDVERLLARSKSISFPRTPTTSVATPSDQKPREEKSAPYRDARYATLLGTKGSFMTASNLGIVDACRTFIKTSLEANHAVPKDSLFRDDVFISTCQNLQGKNEARVIQDITRLIVPSAENLATFGAAHLDILAESVNEGWNNSVPLTGIRPQPDYSVGFRREAFTDDQLKKLSPFIGNFLSGDQSFFMGTYYMYFPFLTCEVQCGDEELNVADRQNAHSMTLAARAVVELFRLAKREDEVHRQLLAFSISHDDCSVRIYGCYPVLDGKKTEYHRHPIHRFDFTALEGKEKWTAYRFTKNIYEVWMPQHFRKICAVIDQLPSNLSFSVSSLSEKGGSRRLGESRFMTVGS
ncbi:hypothetical protein CP533_1851 [Ophiocordyceps camponoti-saundersi (nom. inval.)]|nr:hypothetical protein CP533_1851 [Ophiocordyceps camponoti-saundersi (nom. inval.)]